jgi:hypothetical protein
VCEVEFVNGVSILKLKLSRPRALLDFGSGTLQTGGSVLEEAKK